jgi:hypothetical protein
MYRKLRTQRAELWRERLARQAAGPCSVAEFCRREGVSQPSFYQWRKRLSTLSTSRSGQPAKSSGPQAADVQFVSVELPASLSSAGIQIDLPNGAVVRLPGHATAEIVAAAVQAASASRAGQEAHG